MRMFGVKINSGYHSEARVFSSLLRHRADAYEAQVLYHAWHDHPNGADQFAQDAGLPVVRLDMGDRPHQQNLMRIPRRIGVEIRGRLSLPSAIKLAQEYAPDVIYSSQQCSDCAVATQIAQCLERPQIIHLHYIICQWLGQAVLQRLKTCDHVVTVSDYIREQVLAYGVPADRVTTVRNMMRLFPPATPGVRESVRRELALRPDATLIGIIGRLEAWKGQADTIKAFARIASQVPNVCLVVVGEGGYRKNLEMQAAASGFGDRIRITGNRTDVPRLLSAFDIFPHPSREDPAPLAVLEACASGLPVVAYDEGGVREFLLSGKTGFLTPPGEVEGLAQAFLTLLRNPSFACAMGAANRERIRQDFTPEAAGRRFAEVVQAVAMQGKLA